MELAGSDTVFPDHCCDILMTERSSSSQAILLFWCRRVGMDEINPGLWVVPMKKWGVMSDG